MHNLSALTHSLRSALLCAILALASCADADSESEAALIGRAQAIHDRVITLDTHHDISPANFVEDRNYTMDLDTQVNLPKMEAGGLDVSWMVVFVGQGPLSEEGYAQAHQAAMDKFNAIHWFAEEKAPDQIEIAYTSDDVRRISASGKKVAMIAIENAYQVGSDLSNIKKFQELGGRYMSLAHNGHSQFADSNTGERDDVWLHNGLSELGREALAEMNKWGIMVDISHPSKQAIMEMFELTQAPLIASHSSARSVNDVSRNLDDEQLLALKENGGVVQTVAFASYVNSEKNTANREALDELYGTIADEMGFELIDRGTIRSLSPEARAEYQEQMNILRERAEPRMEEVNAVAPAVDVADFVDHVDYIVDLIGLDHVGISSDFDGGGGVEGWNDTSETFNVTLELVRRGYTEEEIGKLWSGNLLRVLDEVQRVAREIQSGE
ncbi:MAG: dipeptidase [Gemmatimonadota bacterium]|nr:dipeptidase [Gemmatimonadota bacterium]